MPNNQSIISEYYYCCNHTVNIELFSPLVCRFKRVFYNQIQIKEDDHVHIQNQLP